MKLSTSFFLLSLLSLGTGAAGAGNSNKANNANNGNGNGNKATTTAATTTASATEASTNAKTNGNSDNSGNNGNNGSGGGKNTDPGPRKPPADAPDNANNDEYAKGKKNSNPGKGKKLLEEGINGVTLQPGEYEVETGDDVDTTMEAGGRGFVESKGKGKGKSKVDGEAGASGTDPLDATDDDDDEYELYGEELYTSREDDPEEKLEGEEPDEGAVFTRRQLQNLSTRNIGTFAPLTCNGDAYPTAAECEAGGLLLSSIVAASGETLVPCGACYKYDLGAEATLGGLNIVGKLYVPPNYKSTLSTPYVFVQGELEMSDTNTISPDNESMKIVLTGTTHVTFTPAESNVGVAGTPFNAGMKPFLVAGGKLTIRGWDESPEEGTATWTPLLEMAEKPRPTPTLTSDWVPEPVPQSLSTSNACPRQIINDDFTHGIDTSLWAMRDGTLVHNSTEGSMVMENIHKDWQGFKLDLTNHFMDCPMQEGTTLLVTMRMKVEKDGFEGQTMPCEDTNDRWNKCMRLSRKIMVLEGDDRYYHRTMNAGIVGHYGEWFTFSTTYKFEEGDYGDNVWGNIFYLEEVEPGTEISIDQFVMEYPSEKSFPKVDDACYELIVNGDAENTDGGGWAFWPMQSSRTDWWEPTITEETLEDGSINKFYRSDMRKWHSDTIRAYMVKDCFENGYVYQVSMRLRVSNFVGPLSWYAEFKGPRPDGSCCNYKRALTCDEQTEADGWVTCSANVVIDDSTSVNIQDEIYLQVIMDYSKDSGPVWATIDYDDISVKFFSGPAEGLKIDSGVAKHWGPNTDLHITSSTLKAEDSQNAVITQISDNGDGTSNLKLEAGIDAVISEKDIPGQGVEIALLSRNIKIVSEEGSAVTEGGYLQVFHTPGVAQIIEGVEFVNMGQENQKNRYPIQFLYAGDVPGTSISRNSIHDSNYRCIAFDGTSNATISSNVAYNTAGNCYTFNMETEDLLVTRNLASLVNNNIHWNNKHSDTSAFGDYDRRTFEIRSSQNDYIGNVAAGSAGGRGFWWYNNWQTLGEDNVDTGKGNHRRLAMRTFKDNKAHSNWEEAFGLYDFEQFFTFKDEVNVPIFENIQAYRNSQHGIETNNIISAEFHGGVLADNVWGIHVQRSDRVLIKDFDIKGYQEVTKNLLSNGYTIQCSRSDWNMYGIRISPRKWRTGESDPNLGLRLKNVALSDFDHGIGNCPSSWPLTLNGHWADKGNYVKDGHFDYVSSFDGVTVNDSRGFMLDGCRADSDYGIQDLVFNDLNGSLDPSGVSTGPSAFVSNFPSMKSMFGGACVEYPSNCMAYCTGVCLRTVSFLVEKYYTENWKLRVTNDNGDSLEVSSVVENPGDEWRFSWYWTDRKFSVSLPAGTYTAEFIDENGAQVWPTFAKELWEKAPDCSGGASPGSITLLKPQGAICDDLFRNGGQDAALSSYEPWVHTDTGLEVGVGLGIDGSNAIVTANRGGHWTGLGQHIDSRCVDANVGKYYEINAWIRLLNSDKTAGATNIDPNNDWWRNQSPIITLIGEEYRDASTMEYAYRTEDRDKAVMSRPYDADGWNLISGIFRIPANMHLFVEIERAPDNVEFYVDDASLTPIQCNPDELVRNGDFEDSHQSKFWDTWGGTVGLDVVPGYGGGNALKSFQRTHYSYGQAQEIDLDCVEVGDRVSFQARIKFETNGETVSCNPNGWDNAVRCSDLFLHTNKQGVRNYIRVGWINTDSPVDGWYDISGVYTMNEHQAKADFAKIYFDGVRVEKDVIVDDVQVKKVPNSCQNLIMNPSFEEGAAFWSYIDRRYSKISLVPGAGGSGNALRSYDRNLPDKASSWRGVRQELDTRCLVPGEEYSISAKFKLVNATSQEGVMCDTNDQDQGGYQDQCPHIVIYGWGCDQGDVYWKFWNQISNFDWDSNDFNDFSNSFVVDSRLASCDRVHVYIHRVHHDLEIIMDDVQISLTGTEAPTSSPTPSPTVTDLTGDGTSAPTDPPTLMPTSSTVTVCPPVGSPSSEVAPGPVMLERSASLCILTKAVVDSNGTSTKIAPVARSYDGGDWEIAAGHYATSLLYGKDFGDFTEGSQITLPSLNPDEKYFLTSYSYSVSDEASVARLLESATFGTTAQDLADWSGGAVTKDAAALWIKNQISLTPTSHREFFRKRTNPRYVQPQGIGVSDHPCRGLSRWRKYAFSRKDGDTWFNPNYFEASFNAGDPYITIKMNGMVRTVVEVGTVVFSDAAYTIEYNTEYRVCSHPEERVGANFRLRMPDDSCQYLKNPNIVFYEDSVQPEIVLDLPGIGAGLEPMDEIQSNGGEFFLLGELTDPICNQLEDFTEERSTPIFGKLPDGSYLQFDARLSLEENTLENHLADGGGLTSTLTEDKTLCANVPRTFLNEDSCSLSYSVTACGSAATPNMKIELSAENLAIFHNITGQYVYATLGLPVTDFYGNELESPCTPTLRSRWEIKDAADCTPTVLEPETNATLHELITLSGDANPFVRDIVFPSLGYACGASDTTSLVEVEIIVDGVCYKRVHPEHLTVYDYTYWTDEMTHPGNMVAAMEGEYNPIKKWMDIDSSVFLVYPSFTAGIPNHSSIRWETHHVKFPRVGRFGDFVKFVDFPNDLRVDDVSEYFGEAEAVGGIGSVLCGSPYETANDPTLGHNFEVTTGRDTAWGLWIQREQVWSMVNLEAKDQLRQRMAWALAQLLVVVRSAIGVEDSHSEAFLTYYDIFVRNAFGNYRDILREISYSPLMAENLSFLQSKSAAYMWEENQKISFADENFAREIMQLFSTGLYLLNLDGTPKLDDTGKPILVYTNDEIMSFARIWTGFDYQKRRGNVEEAWSGNRNDPMTIQSSWRDKFPKSNLSGGYIGDGYPLCVELPEKMFLRKGASYRLLGASFMPELMEDHPSLKDDPTAKKFVLDSNSSLKATLCNLDAGTNKCQYKNTVTLDTNLACTGKECDADTLRVVDVGDGIFYEYVRPACVEQALFRNPQKVINRRRMKDASCANPLLPYASEACCSTGEDNAVRSPDYLYDVERVLLNTAVARCEAMGKIPCDFNNIVDPPEEWKQGYHWTTDSCIIRVKVNSIDGQVAVVYEPEDYAILHDHINVDNRNFFKVYWEGDHPKNDNDVSSGNTCGNGACTSLVSGGCLCETTFTTTRVFKDMPSSVEEVMSKLRIGAFDPASYDVGTYPEVVTENGVTAYLTSPGTYSTDTVFEVTDSYGRLHRFKNKEETVQIDGAPEYEFRNAPSFMSALNSEADRRDAQYETEAALDHYLYHDNTAPFIAFRLIQRFTTSNPNPRYVKAVATAFRSGTYDNFGTGVYGDLEATIAAVLLDPEARSVVLDVDPFHGSLREPLLRVLALMRSMEITLTQGQSVLKLDGVDSKIGQMAHSFPTVFSFFLPEYQPDGRPGDASLVGPETMIMDMPKMVGLLNGMFSLVKYGLNYCNGGFATGWSNCVEGDYRYSNAWLTFSRPYVESSDEAQAEAVVSELSILLTSGRLSDQRKDIIKASYIEKLPDADASLRIAIQLLLTTPEFHTTNTVTMSGDVRGIPEPPQGAGVPYKSIVYVMFAGGCDSYNMLVPKTCTGNKDMYAEYKFVREEVALANETLLEIDASTSNQICETFGLHPRLSAVQAMYNEGDLLFFTNTGVLTKETDKENFNRDTETQLFAHNMMQRAAQRIDPLKAKDGTGILGRISDALVKKGLNVGTFSVEVNSVSLIGEPGISTTPFILSRNGFTKFNNGASSATMDGNVTALNEVTSQESGVFGDLWSATLVQSLHNNDLFYDTLSGLSTTTTFPTSYLGRQLEMVAKMIDSRDARGVDADMFFLATGGWDTHSMVEENLDRLYKDVDESFKAFADEMKLKNIWDNVVVIETSDFARTLNPNSSRGSDHGWGGNYMMFGGAVKGGQIAGTYPDDLTDAGPYSVGRGRMIPSTSWDAVFLPLAEWAGATSEDFLNVCPNKGNFSPDHFFDAASLFELN